MPALLEALRGRLATREANALDTIAAGARAAARGESYDAGAVEKALADTGKTLTDFERAVEVASKRLAWLADFDRLAAATAKVNKLEAAATSEKQKMEAARAAFIERANAIDAELAVHRVAREKGTSARSNLLDPRHVPGLIGDKYRAAISDADAADSAVQSAQSAVREHAARIKSEEGWIKQLTNEQAGTLKPDRIMRASGNPFPEESYKLQDHRNALASAQRRKAAADADLVEAEKVAARCRKAVEALVPEVIKA